MDLRIVKPNSLQRVVIQAKLKQLGYTPDAELQAYVDSPPWPWVHSETINIIRLPEETAETIIAHEGLHIVLLRIGERRASFMLDYDWARGRIDRCES